MKRFLPAVAILVLSAVAAWGAPPAGLKLPSARIAILRGPPPVMNGLLTSACWNQATQLTNFVLDQGGPLVRAKDQTVVYLLRGKKALYIGAKCYVRNRRSVSPSDWFEVFIANRRLSVYYHFWVHPSGATGQDGTPGIFLVHKPHWYARVNTTQFDDQWEVEMQIPFSNFDPRSFASDEWRFNACREQINRPHELSEWSNTAGMFATPTRFGRLYGMRGVDFAAKAHFPRPRAGNSDAGAPNYMLLNRSYYTTESTARVKVHLTNRTLKSLGRKVVLKISVANRTGRGVLQQTTSVKAASDLFQRLAISKLPLGKYVVRASLRAGGKVVHFTKTLLKLKPQPGNEVKVNRFSRLILVNGKPFVPIMLEVEMWGDKPSGRNTPADALEKIAEDSGFNTLCLWCGASPGAVAACEKAGLEVVIAPVCGGYGTGQTLTHRLAGMVRKFKKFPNLLGWDIADEGNINGTEKQFQQRYALLKKIDPYHLVFRNDQGWIVGYGGPGGLHSTDIYMGDYGGGQLIDTIERDAVPRGRPAMALQSLISPPEMVRWPTPAEATQWYFNLLVHGAGGAFWWGAHNGDPPIPGFWKAMRRLRAQTRGLLPALDDSRPVKAHVVCDNNHIRFMLRHWPKGGYCLVAVNASRHAQSAAFRLDAARMPGRGTAERLFGHGAVPYTGNRLRLNFPALGHGAYLLKGAAP